VPAEQANHPKFQVLRRLGQGGMGTVYHAKHKVMDRDVTPKVIYLPCASWSPSSWESCPKPRLRYSWHGGSNRQSGYSVTQTGSFRCRTRVARS
jgi:hypothetical protein